MKHKPVEGKGDLWLHYQCPECDGIEKVHVKQTKRLHPCVNCPCGHTYDIEPIKQVNIHISYGQPESVELEPVLSAHLNASEIRDAHKALASAGYPSVEATEMIHRAIQQDDPQTVENLVLKAVAQAATK